MSDLVYEQEYFDPANSETQMNPPAVEMSNKVRELFKLDPKLKLSYSDRTHIVKIVSEDLEKAQAVRYVLPDYIQCFIEVYYKLGDELILLGSPSGYHADVKIFRKAFEGNPLWVYTHEWHEKAISNAHCWAGFIPTPVCYVNDDLSNLYGDAVVLPVDLAKEVLDTDGIHYCSYNSNRQLVRRNTVANSIYEEAIDWNYDE